MSNDARHDLHTCGQALIDSSFTAITGDVSTGVQKAIAHNVCGGPPAKLSKADWKSYAAIKQILQIEHKLAKENAETNGWNVADERAAVTEQFCAAVKTR
jgi:hypothetical protein